MNKLIIMRGLPGSGKTTKANQLSKGTTSYHSTDSKHHVDGDYKFRLDKSAEYHIMNQADAMFSMRNGVETVIIDNTNVSRVEMLPYVLMAEQFGYVIEYMEPDTAWWQEVKQFILMHQHALKMINSLLSTHNTHKVPESTINNMVNRWEEIDD